MQNRNQRLIGLITLAILSTMSLCKCSTKVPSSKLTIDGTGATFPLIDTWRVAYQKDHPNVNINYQCIGSGGVKQFVASG
jgi:phosphate transport system substrate-binding protein